jgi:hypothetical protein
MGIRSSGEEMLLQCNNLNPRSTKSDLLAAHENATQKHMHTLTNMYLRVTYLLLLPVDHI